MSQPTAFIGRESEIAELVSLLEQPDCCLLTILAPGGMGKTRLALAIAQMQLVHFEDGVFFVPLAPLTSSNGLVNLIAENIGCRFHSGDAPYQQLLDYFQDQQLLLILDNFEHLLDGVAIITDIIQTARRVKVLVTSREKLRLSQEFVFRLSGLKTHTWKSPQDALTSDAVQLFMQTVHHIRPDFELEISDLDDLARICHLTEGMPLALRLAAGWLDVLTLKQIAVEIQQGIDILETQLKDVPDRHKSMRATLNYSWGLLSDAERIVFMRLSIFRGGFTAESAYAIASAKKHDIRRLVDKALLYTSPDGRMDIHELLRQFGEEKLSEAGHVITIQQAHGAYYIDLIIGLEPDLQAFKERPINIIKLEYENMRVAWWWAINQNLYSDIEKLTDCLILACSQHNIKWDIYDLFETTLAQLPIESNEIPYTIRDRLVLLKEWLCEDLLDHTIDKKGVETILVRAQAHGNEVEMAWCIHLLSVYYFRTGNSEMALRYGHQALKMWRELDNPPQLTHMMTRIGHAYIDIGQVESAQRLLEEALDIRRTVGLNHLVLNSLHHLGSLHFLQGRLSKASILYDEALTLQNIHGFWEDRAPQLLLQPTLQRLLCGQLTDARAYIQLIDEQISFSRDHYAREYARLLEEVLVCISGNEVSLGMSIDLSRSKHFNLEAIIISLSRSSSSIVPWFATLIYCCREDDIRSKNYLYDLIENALQVKSVTLQFLSLPIAAVLLAHEGNAERAVELLALAYTAPEDLMGWIDQWQPLQEIRADLEAQFDQDNYSRIWQRGAKHDVEKITRELVGEFGTEMGDSVEQVNASLLNPLTPKELEVLTLLSDGLTNPQIAERLFITIGTVKGHVNKVLHKLDVTKRQQAVKYARQMGLLKT